MRACTIVLTCVLLAMFFVKSSDTVACSTTILTDCTDCSDADNATNDDCTTTEETVTLRNNRKIVRLTNLQYTNVRRLRVNRNGSGSGTSTNTGTRVVSNTNRRSNRNNRRRNARRGRRG